MVIEKFEPEPDRGLAPLLHQLEQYGGTLTFEDQKSSGPGSRALRLHLPEDEYQEKRCREILKVWHSTDS